MLGCCKKKADVTTVEFWDFCQDGNLKAVEETFNSCGNIKDLVSAKDPDKKTGLHLVSSIRI